jgi:hypothetical protein
MKRYWWVLALLVSIGMSASAGERWRLFRRDSDCCPPPCLPAQPLNPAMPGQPNQPNTDPNQPNTQPNQPSNSPFNEALASAGEGGTQPAASYMPGFFGDVLGGVILVPGAVPNTSSGGGAFEARNLLSINVSQASAIKISDSDSPRPMDRVYYLYNFFGDIPIGAPGDPTLDVHRHVIGFEKTFLDGNASIGMRLPFFDFAGSFAYDTGFTGDLSILTKFALINDRRTGDVLSMGVAVATPTGGTPSFYVQTRGGFVRQPSQRDYPVTIQPYFGYIYNFTPRLYFQGFHSVLIPTLSSEPTFMANDVALGYWLYRNPTDSLIRGIIPTVEVHVNTPFNHRDPAVAFGDVQMLDSVNLTSGFYVMFPRSVLGVSVAVPLSFGPNTIEALASYTLRF